jgi:hypothetical protein
MVREIPLDDYAAFIGTEYLDSFVSAGGSAVKIAVVPDPRSATALIDAAVAEAQRRGYAAVGVDSARTRINFIHQIFSTAAAELDWSSCSRAVVASLLAELYGESVRGARTVAEVVELTGLDRLVVRTDVRKALTDHVFRNYELAKDFRLAMGQLCWAELEPEAFTEEGRSAIMQWLQGELRLVSALKDLQIFHKITRHNARAMLGSSAKWLHQAGSPGLFLVLNIDRLAVGRRGDSGDDRLYYTPAAVMDAFEVLRQFIDATDEMEHMMVLVVAPEELLDTESKRGFAAYRALRNRIWDDVRDRERPNPCAPMVRVGVAGGR